MESPSANRARRDALELASLRPSLDEGWPAAARWLTGPQHPGGGLAALDQPVGEPVVFRLRAENRWRVKGGVTLVPGRRTPGIARLRVATRADGHQATLWSGYIGRLGAPLPSSLQFDVELGRPDGAAEFDLVLEASGAGLDAVRWLDPVLERAPGTSGNEETRPVQVEARAGRRAAPGDGPLISILTPVHDPDPDHLDAMLASVAGQTRDAYELCLVDDGSRDPRVIERLREAALADERIHLVRNEEALGIAGATNTALSLAGGEFVALLDHDDTLAPNALEAVAAAIVERPETDFIYSDEVLWGDGGPVWVHLKPDWSLDLMRSVMYTCHLSVYRRALVDELGGLRSEFDGSQDYDLALRVSERTDNIVHLPRPLYNWRVHGDSVTGDPNAKGYAYPAGLRALNDHLGRCGVEGEIQFGSKPGQYRVLHEVPETARVAVILPVTSGAPPDLRRAAESWSRTEHPAWELVLAGPDAVTATWTRELSGTACADRLRSVSSAGAVGGPGAVNRAVAESEAEFVVLLDAPAEALTPTWLTSIVGYASERGVGVAAAKTLAADGRIEHAGLVIDDGAPLPVLHGAPATDEGPVAITVISSNFSAVSGIVAVRRSWFEGLGGLDEDLRELAVPDLCLRAGERGLRIVSVPDALMRRLPGAAPVNDLDAHAAFRDRWRERLPRDPYLNPNYVPHRGDFVPQPGIV